MQPGARPAPATDDPEPGRKTSRRPGCEAVAGKVDFAVQQEGRALLVFGRERQPRARVEDVGVEHR